MQLPRGTFREIQKNQKTGDLLKERSGGVLRHLQYSCRDSISTLVLKSGTCILAEYNTFKGDAALEGLLQTLACEDIDAALSTLDEYTDSAFPGVQQIRADHKNLAGSHRYPRNPQTSRFIWLTGQWRKKPARPVTNITPSHEKWSNPAAQPAKMTSRPLTGPKNPTNGPPVLYPGSNCTCSKRTGNPGKRCHTKRFRERL